MNIYKLSGLLAPIVAFTSIILAIITHPWFSLTDNAISDLGAINVEYNYILNYGLILSGVFGAIFSIGIYKIFKSTISKTGSLLVLIGCIFLILIGLFPEGSKPHYYVSVLFFAMTTLGIFLVGIGTIGTDREYASTTLFLVVVGFFVSIFFLNIFPGVAMAELTASMIYSIWMVYTSYVIY